MATQTNSQNTKAAEQQSENPPAEQPKKRVLHVHCPRERFRRGGRDFGRGKNIVPVEELSKEQYKAIKAEPLLAVTEHDAEDEAEA